MNKGVIANQHPLDVIIWPMNSSEVTVKGTRGICIHTLWKTPNTHDQVAYHWSSLLGGTSWSSKASQLYVTLFWWQETSQIVCRLHELSAGLYLMDRLFRADYFSGPPSTHILIFGKQMPHDYLYTNLVRYIFELF